MGPSPPSPMYNQYPDMELVSYYVKGGYHPVDIDDVFHNRYRVVNKLGHGTYATVWLVEDTDLRRLASLKVMAAEAQNVSSEIDVVRHLRRQQERIPPNAGAEHVIQVFDDFEIEGPNGTHRCIVTELLGPSLAQDLETMYEDEPLPLDVTKKMAAQIARGVAYLHRCGVVHGDLHVGNMLLYHPKFADLSPEEGEKYFGRPLGVSPSRRDGLPIPESEITHVPKKVHSSPDIIPLLELCLASTETVHVKICDFGEAFLYPPNEKSKHDAIQLHTPRPYCAPEVIFRDPAPDPATDIWALAVLMHMVLASNCPIFFIRPDEDKIMLREMVLILGKFPERWWTRWESRAEYFGEGGTFIGDRSDLWAASGKLLKVNGLSEEDGTAFENLVRGMVAYEMEDRITADEVVQRIPAGWLNISLTV